MPATNASGGTPGGGCATDGGGAGAIGTNPGGAGGPGCSGGGGAGGGGMGFIQSNVALGQGAYSPQPVIP